MNQCIVPAADWDLRHQRQEQNETEQEQPKIKRFSHMPTHFQNSSIPNLGPMSNYEVAKLTWENGQLAVHGLGGLHHSGPTKPTWGRTNETLESIVDQAMCHNHNLINAYQYDHQANPANKRTLGASSRRKLSGTSSDCSAQWEPSSAKKRAWSELNQYPKRLDDRNLDEHASGCASASATFCRDNDSTTMTWASFDSLPILKTKSTDEDSACHDGSENQDEDRETKTEITVRSHSSRKSRSAAVHNLSERRRRDRINQKMKALQKLVPNASKTDKASMLDEVIDYLKQLQAQNQLMMSMRNSTPHIMTPVGMQQQHLQMCLLAARMGMGAGQRMPGMGMLDMSTLTRGAAQSLAGFMHPAVAAQTVVASAPPFLPPYLLVPPMVPAQVPLYLFLPLGKAFVLLKKL